MISEDNFLNISNTLFYNISGSFLTDYSKKLSISFLKNIFEFDKSYNNSELFILQSYELNLIFNDCEISNSNLEKVSVLLFYQKFLYLVMENLIIDYLEKILNLIEANNPEKLDLKLSKISFTNFKGSLLISSSKSFSVNRILIYNCTFTLNNVYSHLISIENNADIVIKNSLFSLNKEYFFSALYFYGKYKEVNLNISRCSFNSINTKNDFYLKENFNSTFGLIHGNNGLSNLVIFQSSISLGLKNLRCILFIPNYKQITINSTYIIGNYLNQISSLFILAINDNCLFIIKNSKLLNNKVAQGALIYFKLDQSFENNSRLDSFIFDIGENNVIKKNSFSPQGGSFYFNTSKCNCKNISQEIIIVLRNFKLNSKSLYNFGKEIVLFFEGSQENLLNIKVNLNTIFQSGKKKGFGNLQFRTIITSFRFFDQTKQIKFDSFPTALKIPNEISNNKTNQKIFLFCVNFFDFFDQKVVTKSETDLYPLLNKRAVIPYIKLNFTYIYFQYYKGSHCAYRFFLEGEYTSKMGKEFNFSILPGEMTKFIPTLIQNLSSIYYISFKVHDCIEGELFKDNQCTPCPRDTYLNEKVVGTLSKCISCTEYDYFYCYGGNMRSPKPKFWRFSNISSNFIKCPSSACLGDVSFVKNLTETDCLNCYLPASNQELLFYAFDQHLNAIGFCEFGYNGNLCSVCIEGFGSTENHKCTNCNLIKPYIVQSLIAALNLFLFYYSIWISIKNNRGSDKKFRNSPTFINDILSSYLLDLFFTNLNIICLLKILPFELDDLTNQFISYSSQISPTEKIEIFSFGCLLKLYDIQLPPVFFELLINLIFLGTSILILFLMFFLQIRKIKNKTKDFIIPRIKGILLIFIITNIIRISNPNMRLLLCANLGDENMRKNYLLSDFSIECNSEQHFYFKYSLSIPLILVFCLIIPGFLILKLFNSKNNQKKDPSFFLKYGYFIYPYHKRCQYFHVFLILNKLVIIMFKQMFKSLIITNNQPLAPGILIFYLLIFYNLQMILRPYNKKFYRIIHKTSILSLKTSISNSLVALIWTLLENTTPIDSFKYFILIYLGLTNLVFFLKWIWDFSKTQKGKFKKLTIRIRKLFKKTDTKLDSKRFKIHKNSLNKGAVEKDNIDREILNKILILQIKGQNEINSLSYHSDEKLNKNEFQESISDPFS